MKRVTMRTAMGIFALVAALVMGCFGTSGCGQVANSMKRGSFAEGASVRVTVSEDLQDKWVEEVQQLTEIDGSDGMQMESDATSGQIIAGSDVDLPRAQRECTIMVYMVGSDLETNLGLATADIEEMLAANLDASRYNLVVFTGGAQRWHGDIPNNRNCVAELADGQAAIVASTETSQNMGDPATLTSFITWAEQNYPSERTALVLWDHGGGPSTGYGIDQLYGRDYLTLQEMTQAMANAGYGDGKQLDWVGFDACLMGSIEVMQCWQPYAQYFVGSEDLESAFGWDYAFLSEFGSLSDPRDQVKAIVDAYDAYFAQFGDRADTPNATLSAVDLSKLDAVEEALDGFAVAVLADLTDGRYAPIAKARHVCRTFGPEETPELIDLGDFAERLGGSFPEQTKKLKEAMDAAIVANSSNLTGAHGMSMYFPQTQDSTPVEAPTEGTQRMIGLFGARGSAARDVSWSSLAAALSNGNVVVDLDPAQVGSMASASYTILYDLDGSGWIPIMSNVAVDVDQDGTLTVPGDPLVVCAEGSENFVPLRQVDASPTRPLYRSTFAALMPGAAYLDIGSGEEWVDITLSFTDDSGEAGIVSVVRAERDGGVTGRYELDVSHYKDLMLLLGTPLIPQHGEDGTMLPCSSWEQFSTVLVWTQTSIGEDMSFSPRHVSELGGRFAVQVCVCDANGIDHATEIVELQSRGSSEVDAATDQGMLTFLLKGDHAELVSYTGYDETLDIPDQVEGLPVTVIADDALSSNWTIRELSLPSGLQSIGVGALCCHHLEHIVLPASLERIGEGAFSRCFRLTEVELPEGLTYIGSAAFVGMDATSVTLPASLTYLGEGAFTGCTSLTEFKTAKGCTAAVSVDGVLYSADKTVLVAFPAGRTGSFDVPAGTRKIGYAAFALNGLESVSLPDGLVSIDNCAFLSDGSGEDSALAHIDLSDSLEEAGAYAFGTTAGTSAFKRMPYIETLALGEHLRYVGPHAFSGLRLGAFQVAERNPFLSSPGGMLANSVGDTILEVPRGIEGPVVVPEGVTTLGDDVFSQYPAGTDFVLPGTVSRISVTAFPYHFEGDDERVRVFDIALHGQPGSAAEQFAERYGIPFDDIVDPVLLTSESVTVQQGDVEFEFAVGRDQAVLTRIDASHAAKGSALVVPDEVQGVPVTGIAKVDLSTRYFDAWSSVVLPATLTSIDPHSLEMLCSEKGFELSGDSDTFSVDGGVLFTADGTELVAFALHDPSYGDQEAVFTYEIPEGTKTIGYGAFRASELERIVFASSVRTVRGEAFARNDRLRDIEVNEGLGRIEARAFDCPATSIKLPESLSFLGENALELDGYEGLTLPKRLARMGGYCFYSIMGEIYDIGSDTLAINSKLVSIGPWSLSALGVSSFDVDEGNPSYASIDGLLMSKDGKRLVLCPAGRTGELHIPEGVEVVADKCLDKATGLTDVYFPDSVLLVDAYLGFGEGSAASAVTFHCAAGSAAQVYASAHGIAWTE